MRIVKAILDFAVRVHQRTTGMSEEAFMADLTIQDSVLYALGQVGEKVNSLSDDFKEKHSHIQWFAILGLRNRLFHSYEDIDLVFVYEICRDSIPTFIEDLRKLADDTPSL